LWLKGNENVSEEVEKAKFFEKKQVVFLSKTTIEFYYSIIYIIE